MVAVLTLNPTVTGTQPYTAAVYPLEGQVPSGSVLVSPDDDSLRSSVISTWPNGSARTVVMAGATAVTSGTARQITVKAGTASGTDLTPARMGEIVTSVSVNIPGIGSASISTFGSPLRTWWVNARTICCRYKLAIGADIEAVIDIQAFASPQNRALVEVVIENGKLNPASPTRPSDKNYAGATVSVNGTTVATVNSSSGPTGSHGAFRAWYASSWIGGDPGVEVTHDTTSMQSHPLFFKMYRTASAKTQYQNDTYQVFSTGRWPSFGMGNGGDSSQIGPLSRWDADYLQTGDRYARRGVIVAALSCLAYNINYRASDTGFVPTTDQTSGRRISAGSWPGDLAPNNEPCWEVAHHGSCGFMAFMVRPSPVFIELAQKVAMYNSCAMSTVGVWDQVNYQIRGNAWAARSIAHAISLTPDADGWKAPALNALYRNVQNWTAQNNGTNGNLLGFAWKDNMNASSFTPDFEAGEGGMQRPTIEDEYFCTEVCKVANAHLFPTSQASRQAELSAIADKACQFPVRFVNEARAGEWRAIGSSRLTISNSSTVYAFTNWSDVMAWAFSGDANPPASSGTWLAGRAGGGGSYSRLDVITTAGAYYDSYFWAALVAAVERDIPGAAAAWSRVTSSSTGISNLSTWADGFATDPRWGAYPRNKS